MQPPASFEVVPTLEIHSGTTELWPSLRSSTRATNCSLVGPDHLAVPFQFSSEIPFKSAPGKMVGQRGQDFSSFANGQGVHLRPG